MLTFIAFVLLSLLGAYLMLLIRSFEYMGVTELKRQARAGNPLARRVYPVRVYGMQLWILLWALLGFVIAGIILAIDSMLWLWLALPADALLLVAFHAVLPWSRWPKPSLAMAAQASNPLTKVLSVLHPVLSRVIGQVGKWIEPEPLRIIHSKAELLEVLEHTSGMVDPVSRDELHIAEHALTFGDKLIDQVMTPRNMVKMLNASDTLGPIVLTELHDSGFSRFPVFEGKENNLVGTLYLKDAVGARTGKAVSQVMRAEIYYVNERQTLDHVLSAFLRTHHHQFIVVNEYEDITGVITIEDVLEQIIGKPIVDEFDQYEDLRAVSRLTAEARKRSRTGETIS